jgi:hypothetical protein
MPLSRKSGCKGTTVLLYFIHSFFIFRYSYIILTFKTSTPSCKSFNLRSINIYCQAIVSHLYVFR